LNIIIPIATFFLGHLWSWAWFRAREKSAQIRTSIREITRLLGEWYTQIQSLADQTANEISNESEKNQKMLAYVNNRLILPSILLNVEVLRKDRRCSRIYLPKVEEFLNKVTDQRMETEQEKYQAEERFSALAVTYPPDVMFLHRKCRWLEEEELAGLKLLTELDKILQELSTEAGRLTK